jgi:simple sugar transport system ATP-binding protein
VDAIAFSSVSKAFAGRAAVSDVTVKMPDHALSFVLGENGAGKSTLLKCAAGLLRPDQGVIAVGGKVLKKFTPGEAMASGVAMVAQHFTLIEELSAIENLVLGSEPQQRGVIDWNVARANAGKVIDQLAVRVDLDDRVATLDVGDKQRLEIARALYRDARVIILDEPTAVLTPLEAEKLYQVLQGLVAGGLSVVVVTHKLDEVARYGSSAVVLRRGKLVKKFDFAEAPASVDALAAAIMGERRPVARLQRTRALGEVGLRLLGVRVPPRLQDATLDVRAGEIVGLAGVEGNGQQELLEAIGGLVELAQGAIAPPHIAMVYGDRHAEGLVLDATVEDNLLLGSLERSARHGWLDERDTRVRAKALAQKAQIVPDDVTMDARALSGGNQQKLVVARALDEVQQGARAMVLSHPTRGVDVQAARAIWSQIESAADAGVATLVISADLSELRDHCDRIAVIAKGRIIGSYESTLSDERLGALMLGAAT